MKPVKEKIKDIILCPECFSGLDITATHAQCSNCQKMFPIYDNTFDFKHYEGEMTADTRFQKERMFNRTLTARIHNIGKKFINSEYTPENHVTDFINNIVPGKTVLELGSGNRRLRDDVINVDLFHFPNVDIVADILKTPFKDNSIDYVILDTVLEHVPEPHTVVKEIYRIMKPGGQIVCVVPWVFPYHGYPKNYFNISSDGLEYLFRDFSKCTVEMNIGPTSALTNLISEYFALAFSGNHKIVYSFFKGLILIPIFLLKYFDRFWYSSSKATRIAAHLCARVRK